MTSLRLSESSPGTELHEATHYPLPDYAQYGENGVGNIFDIFARTNPEALYGYYDASPRVRRSSYTPEGSRKGLITEGSSLVDASDALSGAEGYGNELRYARMPSTPSGASIRGGGGVREERWGEETAPQSVGPSLEDEAFTAVRHITNIVRAAAERCPQLLTDGTDEALTGLMGARQQLLGWLQTHSNENSLPTQISSTMGSTPPVLSDRDWSASTTDDYRETPPLWSTGSALEGSAVDSFSDSSEDATPRSARSTAPFNFFTAPPSVSSTFQRQHSNVVYDSYGSFDTNSLIPAAKRPRLRSPDPQATLHDLASDSLAPTSSSTPTQAHNRAQNRDPTSRPSAALGSSSDMALPSHLQRHPINIPPLHLPSHGTPVQSQYSRSENTDARTLSHRARTSRSARGDIDPASDYALDPSKPASYLNVPQWVTNSSSTAPSALASHAHAPSYHPSAITMPSSSNVIGQMPYAMHQRTLGQPLPDTSLAPTPHNPHMRPSVQHHQLPYATYYGGSHPLSAPMILPPTLPAFAAPNAVRNAPAHYQWGPSHAAPLLAHGDSLSPYYTGEQGNSFVNALSPLHHLQQGSRAAPRMPNGPQEQGEILNGRQGRTKGVTGATMADYESQMPARLGDPDGLGAVYGQSGMRTGPGEVYGQGQYATTGPMRNPPTLTPIPLPRAPLAVPQPRGAEEAVFDTPLITKTVSKTGRPLPPVSMFKVKPSKSTRLPQVDPNAPSAPSRPGNSKMPASLASMIAPGLIDSFDWRKPTQTRKRGPPTASTNNGTSLSGLPSEPMTQSATPAIPIGEPHGSVQSQAMAKLIATSAPAGPINLRDFIILGVLGTGTFGKVHLCLHIASHQYYCMKILKKQTIFRFKQMDHIVNEKHLLTQLRHPGIVQLFATFSTQDALLLLMEYVPGGELFFYIRKFGRLTEDIARFYAAELVLIILHLHERQIVYRDMKPENILLDSSGHLKLADFGFAKRVIDKTWTMCGTPDYLAPEIITGRGHDTAVDWWSLGVLIFEMLAGFPPFNDKDMPTLFRKIQEPDKLYIPTEFSQEAADLVRRLLVVDPSRRLGNIHPDISDIRTHPWFRSIHWEQVQQRLLPGPIIPVLPNPSEIAQQDHDDPHANQQPPPPVHIPEDVQRLFDRF